MLRRYKYICEEERALNFFFYFLKIEMTRVVEYCGWDEDLVENDPN